MKFPWASDKNEQQQPRRRLVRNADETTVFVENEQRGQTLFKRNRTLTGSLSIKVGSVNEHEGDLKSARTHVHHLNAHRRRLIAILSAVLAMLALLSWLLYQFTASISVASTSATPIDTKRYELAIQDYYAGHPFERFRFLLNDDSLTAYLSQVAPEVERAQSTGAAGFVTSQIALSFRQPIAGWQIGTKQYFVDKNGISFDENVYDAPKVMIIDQSGVPESAGTVVASSRFLRFLAGVISESRQYNLVIDRAVIPANTTHAIDIYVQGHTYPIKLSLDRPVGEQMEDLQHAVSYFDSRQQNPQYIDIRVSGKAYYK